MLAGSAERRWIGWITSVYGVRPAHEPDDDGSRSFDHGVPRPPERVIRQLKGMATDRLSQLMEAVDISPFVNADVHHDPTEWSV